MPRRIAPMSQPLHRRSLDEIKREADMLEEESAYAVGSFLYSDDLTYDDLDGGNIYLEKNDHIVEENGKFYLKSKSTGKNLGGPYTTRKQAEARENQVQYFKNYKKPRKSGP